MRDKKYVWLRSPEEARFLKASGLQLIQLGARGS
jgi:hypothetical protein